MATALASLYSNKRVRDDVAMTGELTLSGLVLPVGGIREKVLAAHRTGIRHVILPRDNESDFAKLPQAVRDDMELTLVDCLEDAVKVAIPGPAAVRVGRGARASRSRELAARPNGGCERQAVRGRPRSGKV